jgi:acyl-CoA reductase-like NAD-dependent aldehyde dehydrogenase
MSETSVQAKDELYIAGRWVSASGTGRIEMVSPSTEQPVYSVPEATEAEVDMAVRAARQVFEAGTWSALTPGERADHLFRFAEALSERADTLKVTLANEMGAPIGTTREVEGTVGLTQFFAAHAEKVQFEETRSGAFRPSVIDRLPVGVVAAVVPWNSPLFLLMQKVAPALLAGCPVIIKPAPETSYSAYAVAEALDAAGLPAGLVSVLPAGRERAEYLVSHPGIDKISFTGSTATGRRLGVIAAGQFKRIGLELGGKSAGIVLPDADFRASMAAIVNGTTINSGQACSLLSRVLVPRARRAEFIEAFSGALDQLVVGDALDPATTLGPIVSRRQYERVTGYIDLGVAEGARIARGGGRPPGADRGYLIEPTVFVEADNQMRLAREEIFGPVISVIDYDSVDQAVSIANDTPYGLSGAVFGPDPDAALAVARRMRTGTVTINTSIDFDFDAPYGGFKSSGTERELGGTEGILGFTEARAIGL